MSKAKDDLAARIESMSHDQLVSALQFMVGCNIADTTAAVAYALLNYPVVPGHSIYGEGKATSVFIVYNDDYREDREILHVFDSQGKVSDYLDSEKGITERADRGDEGVEVWTVE